MKESKISLLLLVSLSMLLLAFVVLFIWGFTYYKQSISLSQEHNRMIVKDSSVIAGNMRDSLQKVYRATVNKLNTELDSTRNNVDSFQVNMEAKLLEFNTLKTEISNILQNGQSSASDLAIAQRKIAELQSRLQEWRNKYNDVDAENKRLSRLLQQLSGSRASIEQQTRKLVADNKILTEKVNNAPLFVVSDIELKAMMQLDDREQETYQALQTDEFKGSFELKSNAASLPQAEMFVVILQPDGKVLKQSAWESGVFETADGRKIYSCKMRFDYSKGENKRLSFSVSTDQYQKGNYILQLYHNGKIIARAVKSLS